MNIHNLLTMPTGPQVSAHQKNFQGRTQHQCTLHLLFGQAVMCAMLSDLNEKEEARQTHEDLGVFFKQTQTWFWKCRLSGSKQFWVVRLVIFRQVRRSDVLSRSVLPQAWAFIQVDRSNEALVSFRENLRRQKERRGYCAVTSSL
jgi:hypothetical protein